MTRTIRGADQSAPFPFSYDAAACMLRSMFDFKILKRSKKSRARLGIISTPHGEIETPAFVPVATRATIRALDSKEVEDAGSQLLICNTYHLHITPGEKLVKKMGGIHGFMQWKKPLMTDSGGFQVYSLGFGRDHGIGKILKEPTNNTIQEGDQPVNLKLTEEGAFFRSPIDGESMFIGPKESIRIQEALGADIMYAFDECISPVAEKEYMIPSIERTHRWAKRCIDAKKTDQALYGIVQGGAHRDLREMSAQTIGAMDFQGFGIGGEYGYDKRMMGKLMGWVADILPEGKPRHALGIGHPVLEVRGARHCAEATPSSPRRSGARMCKKPAENRPRTDGVTSGRCGGRRPPAPGRWRGHQRRRWHGGCARTRG